MSIRAACLFATAALLALAAGIFALAGWACALGSVDE